MDATREIVDHEIYRQVKMKEHLVMALKYLHRDDEKKYIQSIVDRLTSNLMRTNLKMKTVLDPTKKEIDRIYMALYRRVQSKHLPNKMFHNIGWIDRKEIESKFKRAAYATVLDDTIINSKILLKRKAGHIQKLNHVERELNEMLLTQMYEQFLIQNKQLLIKYQNV